MFVVTTSVLWRNLLDASRSVSNVFFKQSKDINHVTILYLRKRKDTTQTFVFALARCSVLTVAAAALVIR